MAATRNILKGTFRLSIAIAVLAAIYGFYEQWAAYSKSQGENYALVTTLECGARVSDATLKPTANEFGLLDLSKVGCADKNFLASFSELEQARTGAMRREWLGTQFNLANAASYALSYSLLALVAVNFLGLILVTLRAVFVWIVAGYRATP